MNELSMNACPVCKGKPITTMKYKGSYKNTSLDREFYTYCPECHKKGLHVCTGPKATQLESMEEWNEVTK